MEEHLVMEHKGEMELCLDGEDPLKLRLIFEEKEEMEVDTRLELERLAERFCPPVAKKKRLFAGGEGKVCQECGKEFSTNGGMRFHWKSVHSGLRPWGCDKCGSTFTSQA